MSSTIPKVPLERLCEVFTDGNWVQTKDQSNSGVRLIQTGNIGTGFFKNRSEKARFVSEKTFREMKCTEVFAGDILISRLPDPVGRACIVPDLEERMITAVDCSIVRLDQEQILPAYFNYFARSTSYFGEVDSYCSGATRKRISRKNLGKVEVPLPTLREQKRIVAILDEAFAGIEAAISNFEEIAASLDELPLSFSRRLLRSEKGNWSSKPFSDCVKAVRAPSRLPKKQFNAKGKFPVVSQEKDLVNGFWDNEEDVLEVEKPVIVFGDHTRTFKYIDFDFVSGADGTKIFQPVDSLDPMFLYYAAKSLPLANLGYARHYRVLRDLHISFPVSLKTQQEVAKSIASLEADVSKLRRNYQAKQALLKQLKHSLLAKAFSGELTSDAAEREADAAIA